MVHIVILLYSIYFENNNNMKAHMLVFVKHFSNNTPHTVDNTAAVGLAAQSVDESTSGFIPKKLYSLIKNARQGLQGISTILDKIKILWLLKIKQKQPFLINNLNLFSMFCCTLLYVHCSIAIILMVKRELGALLNVSSWCLVMVERLFLAVPWGCLRFVIVVFLAHTHLLFL